jgi:hypothetical protein
MVPHPSEFIAEEMLARGWTAETMALRMSDGTDQDYGVCRVALDFYDEIGPDNVNMRIGYQTAARLGKAFDVSPQYFLNLERAWLISKGVALPVHDAPHAD